MPIEQQPPSEDNQNGPVRTMRVGDRITVYGDLEIVGIQGRRVQVRVVPASSPPPTAVMFPAKDR